MTATTAANDPSAAPGGHPQRWLILGVICLAQLTVLLDNTVLGVAIPSLTSELHASTADIQWMINAYSLVQSGLLLTAGNAADRYGRKKLLAAGLALFGLGSLAAGLADSTAQLIAARAGMGVGGALLMTTTLAVVMQIFDDSERVKAIALWATVSSLGFAAGPLIGGAILNHFWWGMIFLINIPVALVGLVAVVKLVPESKNPQGERPDLVGALLSTVGMTAVVYAIITGPEHGWTSAEVLVPAFVGVAVLAAFARWELHVPYPMLDMHFFRDQKFVGAVAGAILVMFGMGGSLFLLTQHLQFVLGYEPLEAGLRMAPLALTVVALNLTGVGPRIVMKLGTAPTVAVGMTLVAAGLASIALIGGGTESSYWGMLLGLVLMGVGLAVSNPAMANAIMSAIPPEKAGVGAGVNGTLAEFGNGLGVAVLGAVLNARFAALVTVTATSLPAALAAAGSDAERARVSDAFASGLQTSQLVGAVAVLAGGLLAAVLLGRAERAEKATAPKSSVAA
ncbi:MFS transporter [Streptomyces cinereoruber]|uniref:MFS transporter n=2 Tax=Streptomyces cinereoruber TaxID=67260 RepID=A0AAV4KLX2_9ACTN|nr:MULTISPECIES: MFS transporter [Streptomyces]AVH96414.1 MFS transporter [Streptomyces sp. WAC00288]KYG55060.1 MFS transporter [Streptomyces sp. WAC04657]MBB4159662.1 EmrB/QacA subfamily drug resistance transporter [Streptomyces cinereoruber]MBY8817970.1 MFS transporter [Streptomyces cinereoruber]NIH60370.1 EmrB/QacA subfamily drug resistance transporter [Streptomyces cinereoruber]